jgi:Xaa-Pro aminopeptidase
MNPFEERIARFSAVLSREEIDLCVVMQNVDLYYFTGTLTQGLLLVDASGRYRFCVQKPFSRALEESRVTPVVPIHGPRDWGGQLADFLGGRPVAVLGLETDVLPWDLGERLHGFVPDARVVNVSNAIRRLRSVKDETELTSIRSAGAILGDTFAALARFLKPGLRELEIAAFIEHRMRLAGHQGVMRVRKFNMELYYGALGVSASVRRPTLFDGPVGGTGLYAAAPFFAGNAVFETRDTLLVDLMAGVDGYLADATRTYALDPVNEAVDRTHAVLLGIEEEVRRRLVPGAVPETLYQLALERAAAAGLAAGFMGYQENQVKFLGHGVGLEIDELPVLAPRFTEPLQENMVVAVEPKYFDDLLATGVEDTFIVTPAGGQNVIPFPPEVVHL